MVKIYIDGKEYDINKANNLLQACLSLGFDIPYFCWHPALGSVGSCRLCAVKQFKNFEDSEGRLVMSCMTPILDYNFISINDIEVKKIRKSMIELIMINHPHDCPVCEEGGNCHLQDMTVMTEHNSRRYRFNKRTHHNQKLGPFISHEMNRCISCYRCVRYYKDYADGKDLGVYGTHDNLYFGRVEDGILESEFSGNLVEICPTGVFTDKTHSKKYNRKWDMQFAPSICQQCCIGCNISPSERYGEIHHIENRYNININSYFLCDRGRFGYGYVNRKDRPRHPEQLRGKDRIVLNAEQAVNAAADIIRQAKRVIGIGSQRASIESNFALRQLVGEKNFSTGIPYIEHNNLELILKILQEGGIYSPSLREIESYTAVLILGEDITQVAARLALSVRQAIKNRAYEIAANQQISDWNVSAVFNISQNAKNPLFITNVDKTSLDDIAKWSYHASIEEQARLGFAIANAIDSRAPKVIGFDNNLKEKIEIIVEVLSNTKKPLIISGVHSGSRALIEAAANIAKALKIRGSDVGITLLTSASNSIGIGMIGGKSLDNALEILSKGEADALIVLENDLYRYAPKAKVDSALKNTSNVIVIDHQRTKTVEKAGLVLSTASFAESDGTLINYEGRAQRFFQVYDPTFYDKNIVILESWRWLHSLHSIVQNREVNWTILDQVITSIVNTLPQLKGIKDAAPNSTFRVHGQKLSRSPHRISGRTSVLANINVHEQRQPQDKDTMFAFSMEGNNQPNAPRSQIPFAWAPGWNSPQAWNKFQIEVGDQLRYGDPGIRLFVLNKETLPWFTSIPKPFITTTNYYHIAPYYNLLGSEEMSQRSTIFQKSISPAILIINSGDAARLGWKNNSIVELVCAGETLHLPVRFSMLLRRGLIGLPLGIPNIPVFLLGRKIDKLEEAIQ
ncbi:NADH-quinone oxidoreductase subunit NuoG [Pantoea sp. Aalb]|uniref:NADH-quinone oxidoreductase subunit NuoG n=1 Tax=Pantoea sp. Aalb TaxID=2576762 RepID=UPI001327A575|nr:NADH-quinone oxidoreductase subunit NuoG [Pantoea sp. Aalb]MXP67307.1 NADH-quinone oxidoreductase subunit NuoG [Pantoea sp. Aalb]